jgi:retron-type reverse transcriptase
VIVKAITPVHFVHLVMPLTHEVTAMRVTDTAGCVPAVSGAVSSLSDRRGDVESMIGRSTPTTLSTPGTRTSTTATRTTTTRITSCAPAPSADESATRPAEPSFVDLVAAYFDCRRTKRNSASALAFEQGLERNLSTLHDELVAGTYRPGRSICFVITRPKIREVWAAAFRDRIVHHLLYNHAAPAIEASLIADSCACIPGRGTLYAARRLEAKIRSASQNWSHRLWYLKGDLANFFVAIDKRVLYRLLADRIHESWWLRLAALILFHDPRENYEVRGDVRQLARVPPHKRLVNQASDLGLPIGNLSSQFFANIYLDVLDQYVKHELRARHYIRYVDDFILLHESPQQLNAWCAAIATFLPAHLGAELNPTKTILQPVERGVDFVGHVIRPWRRTIRRRTFNEALSRVDALTNADLRQSANSYFGLLRQATHSHGDRARLANLVRRRGFAVARDLTKAYP